MSNENTVFQSLAIIEEKIREKLTVEMLAESLNFSKYHYQRIFRNAVGDSVMRYVTGRKLTLAAADLAETEDNILDIALKYGFESHEGFTRSFRAYTGVTPKEYRKYHSSVSSPNTKAEKGKIFMLYSKSADEMIRELNSLIVKAKETAGYLRKNKDSDSQLASYSDFWDYIADKTDTMADALTSTLERITSITKCPDEITTRFIIVKTIEDAVFQLNLISFQSGLMVSRARPEQRQAFCKLCEQLDVLSHEARIKSAKIVEFFNELSAMIFGDIRKNAKQRIDAAVARGREAVKKPEGNTQYSYIAEEIENIVKEISFTPLEDMTADLLEDWVFRLDIISFSADMDALRSPLCKPMLNGISEFREKLSEAAEFFRSLSEDIIRSFEEGNKTAVLERTERKRYGDLAFQENILLFCLKGEAQKLERYLSSEQKALFNNIFEQMDTVIRLANHGDITPLVQKEMAVLTREIYSKLSAVTEELGDYGSAVGYIAEELRHCSIFRCGVEHGENVWLE